MARKKKKGSSRKRPLVFTESPVDLSRRFPSPVFAARNPVGADLVPVTEKQQDWVSPQIDPNAPHTPPRRGRTRRNKTACALDPLTQTQRHKEIIRREARNPYTNLQFLKDNQKLAKPRGTCGQLSSDSSTESSTEAGNDESTCSSEEKRRIPLGEFGIAGRTRAQRQRSSQSCYQSRDQLSPKDLQGDLQLMSDSDSRSTKRTGSTHDGGSSKTSRCGKDSLNHHADTNSSDQENRGSNNTSCPSNFTKIPIRDKRPNRILRKRGEVISSSARSTDGVGDIGKTARDGGNCPRVNCSPGSLSSNLPTNSRKSARHKQSPALCGEDSDATRRVGRPRHSRATRTSQRPSDVLAYDTPEAEYGIRVSLRRRRKLLPTPARNKLMMCL